MSTGSPEQRGELDHCRVHATQCWPSRPFPPPLRGALFPRGALSRTCGRPGSLTATGLPLSRCTMRRVGPLRCSRPRSLCLLAVRVATAFRRLTLWPPRCTLSAPPPQGSVLWSLLWSLLPPSHSLTRSCMPLTRDGSPPAPPPALTRCFMPPVLCFCLIIAVIVGCAFFPCLFFVV